MYMLRQLGTCVIMLAACAAWATACPVKIIFDTDMIGDYDDVGAMAVLHKLPDCHSPRACGLLTSPAWECR